MMQKSNSESLPPFHLLIVAAGSGSRMGTTDLPKQYLRVVGKPLLRHTIERFLAIDGLQSVKVVIHPDHEPYFHEATASLVDIDFVSGAETRNKSVYAGLKAFETLDDEALILIHDAARPLVQPQDVEALIHALGTHRAATLGSPVTDTLCKTDGAHVERDGLWAVQTPQAFRYGDVLKAHEDWDSSNAATDDASMARAIGIDVGLIAGARENIKVTVADDLNFVEKILSGAGETRTGMGYDVHAFELQDKDRKLMLGGIEIPHEYGLKGHSDADVALHTITDALLGAFGAGDIGQHFPPSDATFKDMDSAIFLQKAHEMLISQGGQLVNIDLTIICEAPKIGPYRAQMQKRVAEILNIEETRINIKATTTEKLGFTGRSEGIAAQAVVNIRI